MSISGAPGRGPEDWLRPRSQEEGVSRYIAILRERWWLVLLMTIFTVSVATAYVSVAPKTYEAEADLLITPVASGDPTTTGLGLLTESNDPTQTVTTAARLISTTEVGARALQRLGRQGSPEGLLQDVVVEPIAQSNLIAVRATAATAADATETATAVARAATDVRTRQLRLQLDARIPALERQLTRLPASEQNGSGTLGEQLNDLRALRAAQDPTIRLATAATLPTSPASPKPKLALAAGVLGGLILGIGAAFALQALDPRLRREEQLQDVYTLPVLGRIPRAMRRPGPQPLGPSRLSRPVTEAYRMLRATVVASLGTDGPKSLLVTSSASGEGKSTTALNIAHSLSQSGLRVILVEGDVRRPTLAAAIGATPLLGMASVLDGSRTVAESLVDVPAYGERLRFLLAERPIPSFPDRVGGDLAGQLVHQTTQLADFVVIDSPPLTEVSDALPLASEADGVLIVVRLGRSRLKRLTQLGEILAQGGARPIGIAEVGTQKQSSSYYTDTPPAAARS